MSVSRHQILLQVLFRSYAGSSAILKSPEQQLWKLYCHKEFMDYSYSSTVGQEYITPVQDSQRFISLLTIMMLVFFFFISFFIFLLYITTENLKKIYIFFRLNSRCLGLNMGSSDVKASTIQQLFCAILIHETES